MNTEYNYQENQLKKWNWKHPVRLSIQVNSARKIASAHELIFWFLEESEYFAPAKCSTLGNEGSYSKSPYSFKYIYIESLIALYPPEV